MTDDRDFVVELDARDDAFELHVASPAGEHTTDVTLDTAAILDVLPSLQACVLASASRTRAVVPELERPVRDAGTSMFDAVFGSTAAALFLASRQQVESRGGRLRLVLHMRVPELAVLPWELLFSERYGGYLCRRTSLVRYVEVADRVAPLLAEPPLRILGMIALPAGMPGLDAATERERLEDELRPLVERQLISIDWVDGQSWDALQERLYGGCHIFHFIGHGGYDASREEGLVAFADLKGGQQLIPATSLADLLSLATPSPRLVVLNSCQTGAGSAADLFSSTAATLIRSGVPAVVAMQFAITDGAAKSFSGAFYQALAHGRDVDEAVRAGRVRLVGRTRDTLEWATPVLYLRSSETRLFELSASPSDTARPGELKQAKLAATAAFWSAKETGDWEEALELLAALRARAPGDPQIESRYAEAQADARYVRGRRSEEAGLWSEAAAHFLAVTDLSPKHEDAAERLASCRRRAEIESLQAELRALSNAGKDEAVIAISKEIAKLDEAEADPDGSVTGALMRLQQAETGDDPAPPPKPADRPKSRRQPPEKPQPRTSITLTQLLAALSPLKGKAGVSFAPTLDEKRLNRIRPAAKVPDDETILAIVDLSWFSTGKAGVLFGRRGLYGRNVGDSYGVSYDELRTAEIATKADWSAGLKVGETSLALAGIKGDKQPFIDALVALQKALNQNA